MKGKILDFSIADSQGVIAGDDGNRYTFIGKEWKSSAPPQAGIRVDYDTEGRAALAVYFDVPAATSKFARSNADDSPYDDFYRSSDDEMVAGVCAGLAHRWNISLAGLRVATCLGTFFFGITLLIYVVCWIVFPSRPTKNVG